MEFWSKGILLSTPIKNTMAELNGSPGLRHKRSSGVKKSKKHSTRVDLTPMVDLGFLLITFFIFTTALSQPTTLPWVLPKDSREQVKQKESAVLTLIPSEMDQLYHYEGKDPANLQSTSYQALREIIHQKQKRTNPDDFMVLIKPTTTCNFKSTIAVFDEMTINQVHRYALVDLDQEELTTLGQSRKY